jgi:chromate transporter
VPEAIEPVPADAAAPPPSTSLRALAGLYLRLGCTAFGGPAAHIALMRQEVVTRLAWLTEQEFLDLLGAANLIPGPSSTELAIYIGYRRGGWRGLVLAGACFILPAVALVMAFAWAYVRFGRLPAVDRALYVVEPVVVAVIAQALVHLAAAAAKSTQAPRHVGRPIRGERWWLGALGAAALGLSLIGAPPALLLFGIGGLTAALRFAGTRSHSEAPDFGAGPATTPRADFRALLLLAAVVAVVAFVPTLLTLLLAAQETGRSSASVTLPALFLYFLRTGSVVYGSGYVLLAFLRNGLVTQMHWLTETQLINAVAVGQVTPGPVFTTATFIGYLLGGPVGALTATLGIFLPSFLLVAVTGPFIPRLRRSPIAAAFLDGVNVAAVGVIGAVTVQLALASLRDPLAIGVAAVSLVLLMHFRVNSAWLILAAAALGGLLSLIGVHAGA